MARQDEGNVNDNLREWLQTWRLQEYEDKIRTQKITTPKDFKFIKSKEHFDGFISSLGTNIPYMDKLKFEDAWRSIVPEPQTQAPIHFLEKQDKQILTQLYQMFDDLSQDITTVKNAYTDFNQSAVIAKKSINGNAKTMVLAINTKKEELLQTITNLQQTMKNKFEAKLNIMEKMNKVCLQSKDSFNQIARTTNITSSQKTIQFKKLLSMNVETCNDDEKQNEMKENYDNYLYIGDKCVVSGKIVTVFDEQQFNNALGSALTVTCDDVTSKWNLKQYYGRNERFVKFSDQYRSKGNVFRVENDKGTIHHIDNGGFHYILSDTVPIYEGIHRWRVKMSNQKDVFWGIIQPKSCKDRAFEESTAYQIGQYVNYVAVAGDYGNHSPNTAIAPFKKKNVVIDMELNCEKHTLEFHLVDPNEEHVFKMGNIPKVDNPQSGWVLCFCLRYNDHSVQVTKIS